MAITIQNESKKIALTAEQLSSLSAAYKDFMAKQTANAAPINNGTNVEVVEQIVNASAPAPQGDVLITDAPATNQAPSESVNVFEKVPFETVPIVNNSVLNQESPTTEQTVATQPIKEEVKSDVIQESTNNITVVSVDMEGLKKQLLDEYYDLQVHVQEYGIKLEEILEKMNKLTENKTETKKEKVSVIPPVEVSTPIAQNNFTAPTEVVINPVQQGVHQPTNNANQTIPENVNIFDQGVNIFDQAPQTPSNGGQLKM